MKAVDATSLLHILEGIFFTYIHKYIYISYVYILPHFHTNSSKLLHLSRSSEMEKSGEIRCVREIFEELPVGEKN